MAYEGDRIPVRKSMRHYYGDTGRLLFFGAAVLIIIAETTGAELPLSPMAAVAWAIILAIAAGITNPEQGWIHWVNEGIAILGTLVFATSAISHWRAGAGITDPTYLFVEVIALFSLVSLYFTTKTIRGRLLRSNLT